MRDDDDEVENVRYFTFLTLTRVHIRFTLAYHAFLRCCESHFVVGDDRNQKKKIFLRREKKKVKPLFWCERMIEGEEVVLAVVVKMTFFSGDERKKKKDHSSRCYEIITKNIDIDNIYNTRFDAFIHSRETTTRKK